MFVQMTIKGEKRSNGKKGVSVRAMELADGPLCSPRGLTAPKAHTPHIPTAVQAKVLLFPGDVSGERTHRAEEE